jgi:cell wall-associated NlpC family hydrolase
MSSAFALVKIPVKKVGTLLLLAAVVSVSLSVDATHSAAATQGDQIAASAASQANVPYCDGGGSINGPTNGGVVEPGCGVGVKGFDCVTLVQYAVYQATGIVLPGNGTQPNGVGTFLDPQATIAEDTAALMPGDAVFWGGSGINSFVHSGIYAGSGNVWDAININQPVQLHTMTYLRSVYNYDGAMRFWGPGATSGGLVTPAVGMASTPNGNGYWLADASGGVSAYGSAVDYGSMAGHRLNAPIAHVVSSSDGGGYWLVAADGGIFSFGDAPFYGSMGGRHLNAPVVDIAPTPDGGGYWLVAADGGIFSFGDAPFYGSMGGRHLDKPIVGMSADVATGGYWLVASDGGIFSFGAPFLGSTGGIHLSRPVTGMASLGDGQGYWLVASDGGIFSEGSAAFRGSMGGVSLNAPAVGMAADAATGGYWLVGSDGGVFSFDGPVLRRRVDLQDVSLDCRRGADRGVNAAHEEDHLHCWPRVAIAADSANTG